jgi:hypothetical protein
MSGPGGVRRLLGLALLACAALFVTLAVLFYAEVVRVPAESRPLLVAVLVVAAVADAVIGLRLLSES